MEAPRPQASSNNDATQAFAVAVAVVVALLALMLIKVLPYVADGYTRYGMDLPAPTMMAIHFLNILIHRSWMLVLGFLILGGAFNAFNRGEDVEEMPDARNGTPHILAVTLILLSCLLIAVIAAVCWPLLVHPEFY